MKYVNTLDCTSGNDRARNTITWFLFGIYKYEKGARAAVAWWVYSTPKRLAIIKLN